MQGPAGLWVAGQEQGSQGVYEVTLSLSLPGPRAHSSQGDTPPPRASDQKAKCRHTAQSERSAVAELTGVLPSFLPSVHAGCDLGCFALSAGLHDALSAVCTCPCALPSEGKA